MNQISNDEILPTEKVSHEETLDPINVQLGERIREIRKLRLMTQTDVARYLGITFQQVQKYERGKNRISVPMLLQIAHCLDAPADLLLAGLTPDNGAQQGLGGPTPSPSELAECVNVMELYQAIPDAQWRQRACELLRLLGQATQRAA